MLLPPACMLQMAGAEHDDVRHPNFGTHGRPWRHSLLLWREITALRITNNGDCQLDFPRLAVGGSAPKMPTGCCSSYYAKINCTRRRCFDCPRDIFASCTPE